jgi:hypothetical protein
VHRAGIDNTVLRARFLLRRIFHDDHLTTLPVIKLSEPYAFYKTKLIRRQRLRKSFETDRYDASESVERFNNRRPGELAEIILPLRAGSRYFATRRETYIAV